MAGTPGSCSSRPPQAAWWAPLAAAPPGPLRQRGGHPWQLLLQAPSGSVVGTPGSCSSMEAPSGSVVGTPGSCSSRPPQAAWWAPLAAAPPGPIRQRGGHPWQLLLQAPSGSVVGTPGSCSSMEAPSGSVVGTSGSCSSRPPQAAWWAPLAAAPPGPLRQCGGHPWQLLLHGGPLRQCGGHLWQLLLQAPSGSVVGTSGSCSSSSPSGSVVGTSGSCSSRPPQAVWWAPLAAAPPGPLRQRGGHLWQLLLQLPLRQRGGHLWQLLLQAPSGSVVGTSGSCSSRPPQVAWWAPLAAAPPAPPYFFFFFSFSFLFFFFNTNLHTHRRFLEDI